MSTPANTPNPPATLPRWAMLGLFALITLALTVIPPPYSTGIFAAMLAGTIFYGLAQVIPVRWLLGAGGLTIALLFGWWLLDVSTVAPPADPPEMTREGLLAYERASLPTGLTFPWGDAAEGVAQVAGGLAIIAAMVALWRRRWSATLKMIAFALMVWSAYLFRPGALEQTTQAAWVLVGGVLVLAVGVIGRQECEPKARLQEIYLPSTRNPHRILRYALLGTIALATLTAINGFAPTFAPTVLQLALLVMGAGLLVHATRTQQRPRSRLHIDGYQIALVGVLLLAFALRITELELLIHRHIDEVASVEAVMELQADPALQLLRPYEGVARFTRVYSLVQQATITIFGSSLAGLRLVSAFAGTLTVAAVYLLGRVLFDRKTALIAALLLATFPPHLHFSRAGINNIVDPLFGVLALAFLARGLRRTETGLYPLTDFALAGVMLGLTQYFYEGGRLLYPPLVLLLAGLNARRLGWQGGAVLVGTAILVGAPVYLTLVAGDYALAPRLEGAGRDGDYWRLLFGGDVVQGIDLYWQRHLQEPLLHFVQQADRSGFYGGETALLLTAALPFFLLGLGRALSRCWRLPGAMLLLWLAGTVIGNSLLVNPLESARYVVSFPAIVLLAAWGVCLLVTALDDSLTHALTVWTVTVKRAVFVLLTTLTVALAAIQGVYYLRVHAPGYMLQFTDATAVEDVYFRALALPDRTHIHLVTDELVYGRELYVILEFHNRYNTQTFMTQVDPRSLTAAYLQGRPPAQHYAIFVPPYETALIDNLVALGGWEQITRSPYPIPAALDYWMFLDTE